MSGLLILGVSFLLTLAWIWAGGIEYMRDKDSNYGGNDFLK